MGKLTEQGPQEGRSGCPPGQTQISFGLREKQGRKQDLGDRCLFWVCQNRDISDREDV